MDIQYAVAMAPNVEVRYYPVGGRYTDFIPDLEYAALGNPSLSAMLMH
jgi:hypothetical protein